MYRSTIKIYILDNSIKYATERETCIYEDHDKWYTTWMIDLSIWNMYGNFSKCKCATIYVISKSVNNNNMQRYVLQFDVPVYHIYVT